MKQVLVHGMRVFAVLGMILAGGGVAHGQGGVTSSLTGTVVDSSAGVLPGADIKIRNNATAGEFTAVSGQNGTFNIPSLQPGTYTATVSMMGFKQVVVNDIVLNAGTPASIRVTLDVGGVSETIFVTTGSEIVQTQTSAVSMTINSNFMSNLPLIGRAALNSVIGLAGVNTPGGTRDSTINGLPQSTINITLDGMNIQDNYLKTTDGFFARLNPSIDAVEEVTVTTAGNGADSAGQGAVNIRFTTRSGTNNLSGSAYHYLRHDALNANTWFNNRDLPPDPVTGKAPKNELRQYQPGVRIGGPISMPGWFSGHDKAFFFVNYEETRSPSKGTLNRTILTPTAQQGLFRYQASSGVQQVDLLALAAANGHIATFDPVVAKLLGDIRSSTASGSVAGQTDPNLQRFTFQTPIENYTPSPTVRVDYNLSQKHRLTGSFNYQHVNATPDTTNGRQVPFPGFPVTGSQQSARYTTSEAVRSTLSPNLVNELTFGATGGATHFTPELSRSMFGGTSVGNQDGFSLNIGVCCGNNDSALTTASSATVPSNREAATKVIEDKLTWLKGAHSFSFGGAFTQNQLWLTNQTVVPTVNFGIATGDPADAMFNTTNFPGASTAQLNNARALYSILVGRINSITSNARLNEDTNQYELLGLGTQRGRMRELGFYGQDSWRMRPNLTVNYGLRYELQLPFYALNGSYTQATADDVWGISGVGNLFKPGTLAGKKPQFVPYPEGQYAFNVDKNNFAPSLGFAWTPKASGSFLGPLFGDEGDSVLRGAFAVAYERHGISDYSDVFGANPGVSLSTNRTTALANLGPVPLLFRDKDRLGPPAFPSTLTFPFTDQVTEDVQAWDPNLQVPYSMTWTASWQRKLTRDMAIDVRYVGTRNLEGWIEYNFNEASIVENGFLDEFKRAQANLQANIAAGRGATFAYTGIPGTSPLPIYLAYFSRIPAAQAGDPTRYTSGSFTNSNFVNPLAALNPAPYTPAGTNSNTGLDGDPTRRANAIAAGLPANFFRANPDALGGANFEANGGYTKYRSLQLELNKRLSHGLQFNGSYVFGEAIISSRYSLRTPRKPVLDVGAQGGVTHAFKMNWVYELPFGQGRKFGSGLGDGLNRLIGGWALDGVARVQSGRMLDFGNVRLVGMTAKDLVNSVKLQEYALSGLNADARKQLYMLPKDIIENTVRAFNTSATSASGYGSLGAPTGRYLAPANGPDCIEIAQGYGDCGTRTLVITGPLYSRIDLSATKRLKLVGHSTFEFSAQMLNAFNKTNFVPVISTNTNSDNYAVTATQENSSRIVVFVSRINW